MKIRRRGSSVETFFDVFRRRGHGSTTFFKFFGGGVVVLRVLRQRSRGSTVFYRGGVIPRKGSLPEGFSSKGFFGSSTQCGGMGRSFLRERWECEACEGGLGWKKAKIGGLELVQIKSNSYLRLHEQIDWDEDVDSLDPCLFFTSPKEKEEKDSSKESTLQKKRMRKNQG
ncbi:wall-associated receptor kinase 2-like [Cucumis melo var. makuwa]|uniref:Wall-associated receptor kinase 2-like n=1 Tax=Cucumis melo var. makuwa TaxID=1194695 RepID=A0A5A7T3J3_CUCMM|nr:wall-associated receptor kinase 2-like [Cucumis melo var. makuwa]TYK02018.1 wall-associated receptor kinase 2-like [Cucumis melo var. makuwa]